MIPTPDNHCADVRISSPPQGRALADILATEQLSLRPPRVPDHAAENRALTALATTMAESPDRVLQTLVDFAMELTGADAAGVSVVETDGGRPIFRWRATTGTFASYIGGTMPRDFSPCGAVVVRNATQLMADPERFYPYIADLKQPIAEVLLVPFHRGAEPIGTVWVVAQSAAKRFDAEDARVIATLSKFASAAVQAGENAAAMTEARRRSDSALIAGEVGTYEWDIAADRVFGDQNFVRIFGVTLDAAGAAPLAAFVGAIHRDDRDRVRALIDETLRTGRPYEAEYRIAHGPHERWVIARGRVERDPAGRPFHFHGVVLDVTTEKRAERERQAIADEARRQAHIYDSILSTTDDFAYIFDRDGRFLFANRRLLHVWDKTLEQVVGKTCLDLGYPDWHAEMHMREIRQVIVTGRPIRGEVPFTGDSGISGVYDYIFTPVFGPDGEVEVIAGTTRDVTEQRRAEQALRVSEERRQLALQATRDGIWDWNPATKEYVWSDRLTGMLGYDPSEIPQTVESVNTLMHPDDVAGTWAAVERHLRRETETYQAEFRLRHKDGTYRWILSRGLASFDATGQPFRFVGAHTDITAQKQAEEQMRHAREAAEAANAAKDRFLAVLSHELRTPLTPVAITASAMELDPRFPAKYREDIALIRRNVDLETRLIDDLLDLSRVMSGKMRLLTSPTDAHQLVRHVLETVGAELHDKGLTVRTELRAERPWLDADPARLQQVLWNLLKNAAKFTPRGGVVTIRTRNDTKAGRVIIEVADTGRGIARQHLDRIFDPFEQGDGRITAQHGGMGLGLAIAKAVVDLHGGTITADSPGEGLGATFAISLPLGASAALHPLPRPEAGAADERRGQSVRVLLVEDHADTAKTLARLLRLDGMDVHWADSVAAGIALASTKPFDVIVSDLGLPDGTGHDLMRQLRNRDARVVGIAMSGYGMDDDIRRSRDAGFREHLVKPVDLSQLRQAIRRVTAAPVG